MKKTTNYIVMTNVCIAMLLGSCGQQNTVDKSLNADVLIAKCENYAVELQTDSLRNTADMFLKTTQLYSENYYKARHFHILADFNEQQYIKVLQEIEKVESEQSFYKFTDLRCKYQFTKARALEYNMQYDDAIAAFKKCIQFDSTDDSIRENMRPTIVEALLQMMNTYQIAGKLHEAEIEFSRMIKNPYPLIKELCLRDLYSVAANAFYEADSTRKAKYYIDKVFRMPLHRATPQRLFRDYAYASAIYYGYPNKQQQDINFCKKAIRIGFTEKNIAGLQYVIDLLGTIYKKQGKIEDALNLYLASVKVSRKHEDLRGEAFAYDKLSELYLYLGMYRQANEFADHSLSINNKLKDHYPRFCGVSFLRKAHTMYRMNHSDSAIYYLDKANQYFATIPYLNGKVLSDELYGEILISSKSWESQQRGIKFLKNILDCNKNASANVYLQLAKGYILLHQETEGEAMLNKMYKSLNEHDSPTFIANAYEFALQYFLKKHNAAQIEKYAKAYMTEKKKAYNDEVAKRTMQFALKYHTQQQQQKLKLINTQLRNRELQFHIYITITLIFVVIMIGVMSVFLYKRTIYKLRHQIMSQQLSVLTDKLSDTSQYNAQMEQELSELLSDLSNKQNIATITPNLYRESGEAKFRSRFMQLYPSFLKNLKQRVPDITRSEEVLCMLIILDQTPEQIVDILCIARSSVNMTRHRLRQKMNLSHNESLDDRIKELLE